MKNRITTIAKLLFAGAAAIIFSFSANAQNLMQENDIKTDVTEEHFEAPIRTEPKSMLSVDQIRVTEYAAPAPEAAAKATVSKKAVKLNPIKTAVAIAKINKIMKKAELKSTKENNVKAGGGISQNMKLGIIIAAIGLIVAILGGYVSWVLGALGLIALIVGLVIIIIELVNNM